MNDLDLIRAALRALDDLDADRPALRSALRVRLAESDSRMRESAVSRLTGLGYAWDGAIWVSPQPKAGGQHGAAIRPRVCTHCGSLLGSSHDHRCTKA